MSDTLTGRTAVVTGAASGIGLGITTRLIADGAAVFAATRSKEDLDRVHEHALVVGLPKLHGKSVLLGTFADARFDVRQRSPAVDAGFALA